MNTAGEQPTDVDVRFAPRLTEDSLPVTLPKDAGKPLETSAASEQIHSSSTVEDKPVSAGVLDLQLVPQVHRVDLLSTVRPAFAPYSLTSCMSSMQLRELQIKNQQLQQLLQQKDAELLSLQYVVFTLAFAEHMNLGSHWLLLQRAFRCSYWPQSTRCRNK